MNKILLGILLSCGFLRLDFIQGQSSTENFYAYHTKLSHTSTDYFGKYADLIVILGNGRQLEFTRQTNYTPRWVTTSGTYIMDEFFPERDIDYTFDYNYVRLIEESSKKIVVHWRYCPDIELMKEANQRTDPLFPGGFTNVVHEIFTIYSSGKVEREVKDARNSKYYSWEREGFAHRQTLQLTDEGIEYGPVQWGNNRAELPGSSAKNPLIETNIPEPSISFTFNEGGRDFTNKETEWLFNRFAIRNAIGLYTTPDPAIDQVNNRIAEISGHGALYKKGVSGTALAFDGYYTGINYNADGLINAGSFSLELWLTLDAFPFNIAPVIHQSRKYGKEGFYLGVNPYGKLFLTVNGSTAMTSDAIPLYNWTHIAANMDGNNVELYINAEKVTETSFEGVLKLEGMPLIMGINTEKERCSDPVRGDDRNIPFIYGIQGLMDEINIYNRILSDQELNKSYRAFVPDHLKSDLKPAVLPAEAGNSERFGAEYKTLLHHEIWDRMWRLTDKTDIVVKFDNSPASVVYWHGANYGPGWITDNNRWLTDQSSEIGGKYGCSEHMADKQCRHSYARIIENNDARVIIHWRHPCVDVGYCSNHKRNWADEYHTIYPDGTAIRKVIFNNSFSPGFQDIQVFSNPGETALDVMHLNAMTVANTNGDIQELFWQKPNLVPKITIKDATIEWLNSHSEYKVFTVFPGPGLNPWGSQEQSPHTDDPFAGPWNHWPVSLVPSDGRFAVAHDRVTHFAIAAHDDLPHLGSVMLYGFTNKKIHAAIPVARAWQTPPPLNNVQGAKSLGFNREEKAFEFLLEDAKNLSFIINADKESPILNPCFVLHHCNYDKLSIKISDQIVKEGPDLRIGKSYDREGLQKTIIWMKYESDDEMNVKVIFKE